MPEVPPLADLLADPDLRVHFAGVGGSGVSALAQYRAMSGGAASGSDRSFDLGLQGADREALERQGVRVFAQDGTGIEGAGAVVASGAVESTVPDVARARERGVPVFSRAELLAHHARGPSVAVAGTSGKSTVTAMLFEILRAAGRDPSLVAGGRLLSLMDQGLLGNAFRGRGPLVFEADESDGSLVLHAPEAAVLLNLHRDHMEPDRVMRQFRSFRARVRGCFVVSDDAPLREFRAGALVFGFSAHARVRGSALRLGPRDSTLRAQNTKLYVPLPGAHNARNALAAFATALALGVDAATARDAIAAYRGVYRRFQRVGEARGVWVIDDFAHNPAKLRAAIEAARLAHPRIAAYFQPHGFAPLRFQREELARTLSSCLTGEDRLFVGPVYFAGGAAARDISSADLVRDLVELGARAELAEDRRGAISGLTAHARAGDCILVLGARDPTLPDFAREILDALRAKAPA